MKNPVRNVVVEYKNKRARKAHVSLWGDLDLKTIAREVAAETLQPGVTARAETEFPVSPESPTHSHDINAIVVSPTRVVKGEPKPSGPGAAASEQEMIAQAPVLKPETIKGTIAKQKNRSSKRGMRKSVPQITNAVTRSEMMKDICAELSFLEQENAILKRKLIARLGAENEKLISMLKQAHTRTTNN